MNVSITELTQARFLEASIKVLLVEDNEADADLIRKFLSDHSKISFALECADTLAGALARLAKGGVDVALVDLSLPDSIGLESFVKIHEEYPALPIIVFTGMDDETVAIEALRLGAQDYLIKGEIHGRILANSIRYAIERQRMLETMRSLSLLDELTGLYNRRGFTTLAEQQVKLALRMRHGLLLALADVDGLKKINDSFGHLEGDKILAQAAEVLKKSFRKSDIIARIGGDEFAVLAVEALPDSEAVLAGRIERNLEYVNDQKKLRCELALSVGMVYSAVGEAFSVDFLISKADTILYAKKRSKRDV
jgi:diguanylate cyclase (GGDEF)-like protein